MNWLQKIPGWPRTPYGFEWRLLRLLPTVFLAGTLLPIMMSVGARFCFNAENPTELVRSIQLFDFVMIGLVISVWSLVLIVGIGCVIVWLMKGPAYVADCYEVSHRDLPGP
jgi:hypothetical protein